MIKIEGSTYNDIEKQRLIQLWHELLIEQYNYCNKDFMQCENCDIRSLCYDLEQTHDWLWKTYGNIYQENEL